MKMPFPKWIVSPCALAAWLCGLGAASAEPLLYEFSGAIASIPTNIGSDAARRGVQVGGRVEYRFVVDFAQPGVEPLATPAYGDEAFFFADLLTASFVPDATLPARESESADRNFGSWLRRLTVAPGTLVTGFPHFHSGLTEHRSGYEVLLYRRHDLNGATTPGIPSAWANVPFHDPSVQLWGVGDEVIASQRLRDSSGNISTHLYAMVKLDRITPVASLAQPEAVRVVHAFQKDGAQPTGALAMGSDGAAYGTMAGGGAHARGAIYRSGPDGNVTIIHSFAPGEGSGGAGLIGGSGGWMYGSTDPYYPPGFPSVAESGCIFRVGANGTFQVLHTSALFTRRTLLAEGPPGVFYGVAERGGAQNGSVLFRLIPSSGGYTAIHDFGLDYVPAASGQLARDADGNFYGIAFDSTAHPWGYVFRFASDGAFTVLHSFSTAGGIYPRGSLLLGSDGNLYGACSSGGENGVGVIYRLTREGEYTVLRHTPTAGPQGTPTQGLIEGADGRLYGAANATGERSEIFALSKAGEYTALGTVAFAGGHNGPNARLAQGSDGALYGASAEGGAGASGAIYRVALDGSSSEVLHECHVDDGAEPLGPLAVAPDGTLYGATAKGGLLGRGTVFSLSPDGVKTVLHRFSYQRGESFVTSVTRGIDAGLYGFRSSGNRDTPAVLFRVGEDGGYSVRESFDDEARLIGPLAAGPEGWLYGVIRIGYAGGAARRWHPDGRSEFLGILPEAVSTTFLSSLTVAPDGTLYCVASTKRFATAIVRRAPTGQYTTLHTFGPETTGNAAQSVTIGPDGALYGVTPGNDSNGGTFYRLTSSGVFKVLHTLPAGSHFYTEAPLCLASDGCFYGTSGGNVYAPARGFVFRFSPTGQFQQVAIFDAATGHLPNGGMVESSDGHLYGAASLGGPGGGGAIFRTRTVRNVPPIAIDDDLLLSANSAAPVPVLANDGDLNRDPLKIIAVTQGAAGQVTLSGNVITYTAGRSFTDSDHFTYTISDGRGGTATAKAQVRFPFTVPGGHYVSSVYRVIDTAATPAGRFQATLARTGAFSGTVRLGTSAGVLRGHLGTDGKFSGSVKFGKLTGTLSLSLSATIPARLTGIFSLGGVTYVTEEHAESGLAPQHLVSNWTVLFPPGIGPAAPAAHGWAAMKVRATGLCSLAGRMGDGSPFSTGASLRADLGLPMDVTFAARPGGRLIGTLFFRQGEYVIREQGGDAGPISEPGSYADGYFGLELPARGSRPAVSTSLRAIADYFTEPAAGERTVAFKNFPALEGTTVDLDLGGIAGQIAVSPEDVATSLSPEAMRLKVRIARPSGVATGSWVDTAGLRHSFSGVVFRAQRRGVGVDVSMAGSAPLYFTPR